MNSKLLIVPFLAFTHQATAQWVVDSAYRVLRNDYVLLDDHVHKRAADIFLGAHGPAPWASLISIKSAAPIGEPIQTGSHDPRYVQSAQNDTTRILAEASAGVEKTTVDKLVAKVIKLFNGADLSGWTGDPRLWSVKDGAITGQTSPENPAKGNTFLIWTNGTVGDFELRCSFRLAANNDKGFANSGIQYRSKVLDANNWVVGGYQADMEAGPTYTGILYEERMTRGIMAARGEKVVWDKDCNKQVTGSLGDSAEIQKAIKPGDWNDYLIIAKGNHLQHFINGKQTVDVIDDCEAKRAMTGVLALQLHAGQPMTVQFRGLFLQTGSSSTGVAEELQKLQGTWQVTSGQANGEAIPEENVTNISLTIKGASYTAVIGDRNDQGKFKIDSSKNPKQMDIDSETADEPHFVAIYEVGADSLRVCLTPLGGERPKSFATGDDPRALLLNYKKKN